MQKWQREQMRSAGQLHYPKRPPPWHLQEARENGLAPHSGLNGVPTEVLAPLESKILDLAIALMRSVSSPVVPGAAWMVPLHAWPVKCGSANSEVHHGPSTQGIAWPLA